jgi:hypothetical protein
MRVSFRLFRYRYEASGLPAGLLGGKPTWPGGRVSARRCHPRFAVSESQSAFPGPSSSGA